MGDIVSQFETEHILGLLERCAGLLEGGAWRFMRNAWISVMGLVCPCVELRGK